MSDISVSARVTLFLLSQSPLWVWGISGVQKPLKFHMQSHNSIRLSSEKTLVILRKASCGVGSSQVQRRCQLAEAWGLPEIGGAQTLEPCWQLGTFPSATSLE